MAHSEETLKIYKLLLEWVEYYNNMAPFPIYDTEYVEMIRNRIDNIEQKMKQKDYDLEPVVACAICDDLFLGVDELDNTICMRCGSINEERIFKTIYEYNEYKSNKENE